jgi:hypothetical protein
MVVALNEHSGPLIMLVDRKYVWQLDFVSTRNVHYLGAEDSQRQSLCALEILRDSVKTLRTG